MSLHATNTAEAAEAAERAAVDIALHDAAGRPGVPVCLHCGAACRGGAVRSGEQTFCCAGCHTVFTLLHEHGLGEFYALNEAAGVQVKAPSSAEQFRFLDEPAVRERLADYADEHVIRVTFRLPAMHCVACVWLLENLFKLQPGIGASRVNFPRKEVALAFDPATVRLSQVGALLSSLGYEPDLRLADLEGPARRRTPGRLWLQLGLAGFAFGNTMLFSLASYFGLDSASGPGFRKMVGLISLVLAIPVVTYSAADYWRSAWAGLRRRLLNIDVPIALGLVALFAQSTYEVVSGAGEGYFDSLAGLLFFLLCGRLFQQKTFDRLAFDRDYTAFFPLSVTRKRAQREERVVLAQLAVGDRLIVRPGELLPADARLIGGPALIDYSFVTGEAQPVERNAGDHLFAGGRQIGGAIEVETVKPVSQSYLTSLWNQEAFAKDKADTLDTLTNQYSRRFTRLVLALAAGAALFWAVVQPARSLKAFTSVLIVACPCALALAAPFALGSAMRTLARRQVFLKNTHVIETLARVNAVVFDKTGTLTAAGAGAVTWHGAPLSDADERWLYSMTRHSTHPLAVRVGEALARDHFPDPVRSFLETPGGGMAGCVAGREIWMGSAAWLESRGVDIHPAAPADSGGRNDCPARLRDAGSVVHVAIDGQCRGRFVLANALRRDAEQLIASLTGHHELALLSGDNAEERERFRVLFGGDANLHFHQSPQDKLAFVRGMQERGKTVLMAGDGLNDAGALRQSDVGVAVVDAIGAFSPASDVIMAAGAVPGLAGVLGFARQSVAVVRAAFFISALYNAVGIAIAASGRLSPVVCAILMPLSSVTVIAFAVGATRWLGRRELPPQERRSA